MVAQKPSKGVNGQVGVGKSGTASRGARPALGEAVTHEADVIGEGPKPDQPPTLEDGCGPTTAGS
jgi:hypothetical protein